MTITFEMLLAADGAAYSRSGVMWDQLGRSLDGHADNLAVTVRKLPDVWESGPAATAATAHCDGLRKETDSTYRPVLAIAQALAQHGDGVAALRAQAEALIIEGRRLRVLVGPDGSLTMDPDYPDVGTARALTTLAERRDEILRRAADLDARTAKLIAENTASASGAPAARVDRTSVPPKGTDPATVKKWWDSLTPAQRRYVTTEYPDLIGNLDGVPVSNRDMANRIVLDRDHDTLTARRAELEAREAHIRALLDQGRGRELYPGSTNPTGMAFAELDRIRAERAEADGTLRGIERISQRLADPTKPRAYLIGFSSADDGRAIVSVGNPDAANNVLTWVPGTGAELSKIGGDIIRTDRMAEDARKADPTRETAVLLWLGYDAPDSIPEAAQDKYADNGAPDLSRFQNGLRVTHDDEPSRNVVLGHSYGSTVIGHTVTGPGINANDLIFLGSPGVDVNSVNDLNGFPPDRVWASRAEHDMIKRIPDWDLAHGNDPTRDDFGARTFRSDPGDPDNEGKTHSAYWDEGNEARLNVSRIVTGKHDEVTR
ncbi:hypothetical protein GCM10027280_60010 [Micromonospora polyrhachis]|uniref:DUF1023 domain-containing protein n=1 Tax=Micromonospora polyrhachis TaxID=1282883 RepID=A0A7W7SN84_9ACTN|nr:alpha/beta hydrolase [Micromonospora polyrhachis]MBB4957899.1 hypothetical protein [Micromonospora polyrhachis]